MQKTSKNFIGWGKGAHKFMLAILTGALSFQASAFDFSSADDLFSKRGLGLVNAEKAYDLYAQAVKSSSGEDQKYAAGQLGRSALFIGLVSSEADVAKKRKIFERCVEDLEPARAAGSDVFYYYYLSCAAFRGKLSGLAQRVIWATKIKQNESAAIAASTQNGVLTGGFEGGGIMRVLSAVRSNRAAKVLGLFNIDEAVKYADIALNTSPRMDRYYQIQLSGLDYFENYFYLGQAKVVYALEKNDFTSLEDAFYALDDGIAELDDRASAGTLPKGREPETEFYGNRIKSLAAALEACIEDESSWKACAESALNNSEDKQVQ